MAGIAYFDNGDNQPVSTLPYMTSNSQGIYRFYPGFLIDRDEEISWFSKGASEQSLMIPAELQKIISQTELTTENIEIEDTELILVGCSNRFDYIKEIEDIDNDGKKYLATEIEEYKRKFTEMVSSGKEPIEIAKYKNKILKRFSKLIAAKKSAELLGTNSEGLEIPGIATRGILEFEPEDLPEKIDFTHQENRPDFSKIIDSWQRDDSVYGKINYEVFDSTDDKYRFIFCRDTRERAWIGGIELKNDKINKWGLRENWVDTGALTTPRFEYKKQLKTPDGRNYYPEELKEISDNSYVDSYREFLSKIPIINEYQRLAEERTTK